jgi:GDPmannose 4,6-dehydratase
VVEVDPRYFRPTEVDLLLGDPSKAERLLGWKRRVSFEDLVRRMVLYDLELFRKNILIQDAGYDICYPLEED